LRLIRRGGLVVALSAGILFSACASGDGPETSSGDAAGGLAAQLDLGPDEQSCLEARFDDDDDARAALDPNREIERGQLDALERVVLECLPSEVLAPSVADLIARAYAGDAVITPEQRRCLEDEIAGLPREEQVLFITGPTARAGDAASPESLAVSDLLGRVVDACGVAPTAG
jgi:hypothetical protein